jgi:hypothetical protein
LCRAGRIVVIKGGILVYRPVVNTLQQGGRAVGERAGKQRKIAEHGKTNHGNTGFPVWGKRVSGLQWWPISAGLRNEAVSIQC